MNIHEEEGILYLLLLNLGGFRLCYSFVITTFTSWTNVYRLIFLAGIIPYFWSLCLFVPEANRYIEKESSCRGHIARNIQILIKPLKTSATWQGTRNDNVTQCSRTNQWTYRTRFSSFMCRSITLQSNFHKDTDSMVKYTMHHIYEGHWEGFESKNTFRI